MNDVLSFSEEETRRDSLDCAGLKLQVCRQKTLLITDQVIYEVWGFILQEPVVRQAALTLEKCLQRASSLGDKHREIPRNKEHESNRGNKRQTEAVWSREHPGSQYILCRYHRKMVHLWAKSAKSEKRSFAFPTALVSARTKRRRRNSAKEKNSAKEEACCVNLSDPDSINPWGRRGLPTIRLRSHLRYWINNHFPASWTIIW